VRAGHVSSTCVYACVRACVLLSSWCVTCFPCPRGLIDVDDPTEAVSC
jgi:hypothetical protein